MSTTKKKLTPVDTKRCQAMKRLSPFTVGGDLRTMFRCEGVAAFVLRELRKGKDGLRGAMSLCAPCVVEYERRTPNWRQEVSIRAVGAAP